MTCSIYLLAHYLHCLLKYVNTIFNILREWDPLKIILAIRPAKSHVRLINTRSYFRLVVSIQMRVC